MLKHRLITGFSIGITVLVILFCLPTWTHMLLIFALFALAQLEFNEMIVRSGHKYEMIATSILGVLFLAASAIESPVFMSDMPPYLQLQGIMDISSFVMCLAPAVLLACGVFRRKTEGAMQTFALSFAGFWYVAVLLGFVMRLAFEWESYPDGSINYTGRLFLLIFILLVKFSDIGAYTIGRIFGKHKLIPEISPKKTVEGLIGGYLFSIIVSIIIWSIAKVWYCGHVGDLPFHFANAIVLPILLTTFGVIGDLAESLIKRSVNVKDSSSRFPGMGGILDILDSLLLAAPVMYVYLLLFMKPRGECTVLNVIKESYKNLVC